MTPTEKFIFIAILAILALAGAAIIDVANAGEYEPTYSLDTLIGSDHFNNEEYNEKNAGLGIRYNFLEKASLGVLQYRNSHSRTSTLLSLSYFPYKTRHIDFGGLAGFVTGYEKNEMEYPIVFMISTTITPFPEYSWVPSVYFTGAPVPDGFVGYGLTWEIKL